MKSCYLNGMTMVTSKYEDNTKISVLISTLEVIELIEVLNV